MRIPENGSNGVKSEVMRRFLPFISGNPHQCLFRLLATARQSFLASDPICSWVTQQTVKISNISKTGYKLDCSGDQGY